MLKRSFSSSLQYCNIYLIQKCSLHSHTFSRNMQFISNEKVAKVKGLELVDREVNEKPVTILYSWMLARENHVLKYAKFYLERDFNVLHLKISPFDLLRPTKGAQVVADGLLEFLHLNPELGPLLVHGFSVGGYSFCEAMVKVRDNMALHGPLLKRFVGQIWDSAADIGQIPIGLPKAITQNKILQKSMEKYLRESLTNLVVVVGVPCAHEDMKTHRALTGEHLYAVEVDHKWYLKFNYEAATRHYERSSQMMHDNTLGAPGLFIFSKSDPVSDEAVNMNVVNKWEKRNEIVFTKCFEKSPHVSHFLKHKKEYEQELTAFLEKLDLLHPEKKRAVVS